MLFCITYFMTILWIFLYLPLALHRWHVWCYIYVGVHNTYLHGKCFLSALYKDIICLTPTQSTLLFVSSDSSSRAYATFRSVRNTQNNVTLPAANTSYSVFAFARNTRGTSVVFLWEANAVNALLSVDRAGSVVWNATSFYNFFLWMDNQFANENLTEIFVRHFATTWLVYKKCI